MDSREKVLQPNYCRRLGAAALLSLLAVASTTTQAQDSVNDLETPPALTDEELSRSINTAPVNAGESVINSDPGSTDARPGTADVVTEYRIQQKLYLIEVKPRLGGSYYLSDSDGDGSLEEYRQNAESDTNIGKWRLGSW